MWSSLALGTKHRGNGILSAINFVERINTKSGLALGACERGAISAACPSFALINTRSHCGGSVEHNMAEFVVARKYRRRGVPTELSRSRGGKPEDRR